MPEPLLLLGRLIDGTGAPGRERQAVLVSAGRIEAVIDERNLTRTQREGRRVLDAGDGTVLPGLIDTHVHLTFNAGPSHDVVRRAVTEESDARLALRALSNAQAHLAGGVTSLRDTGGRGYVTLAVRDAIRDGLVLGPRVQACGPAITPARGHLNYLLGVANDADEVRRRAAEALEAGADFVKVCASGGIMTAESNPMDCHYTVDELRGAVEEAEKRKTLVAAHVLAAEALDRCIRAGVRSIEHCLWQYSPGMYQFRPEWATVMREKGIFAGITFAGIGQMRYREEVLHRALAEEMGVWQQRLAGRYATEREMIDSGVRYVFHSDCGVRETPFGEFWLVPATACFELGVSPLEAIRAVTSSAAALMGIEQEVGTVAPGMWADLLVTAGDPSAQIAALGEVRWILKDGEVVSEAGKLRVP